jgi:hypothetical protein
MQLVAAINQDSDLCYSLRMKGWAVGSNRGVYVHVSLASGRTGRGILSWVILSRMLPRKSTSSTLLVGECELTRLAGRPQHRYHAHRFRPIAQHRSLRRNQNSESKRRSRSVIGLDRCERSRSRSKSVQGSRFKVQSADTLPDQRGPVFHPCVAMGRDDVPDLACQIVLSYHQKCCTTHFQMVRGGILTMQIISKHGF